MKLLNRSITYISISILIIIGLWALLFYFSMTGEIRESVDEGLNNYKLQIIYQAHQDTSVLKQVNFNEGFYTIKEISKEQAHASIDQYIDTSMYIQKRIGHHRELEPFRMLTSAFKDDGRYYKLDVINSMVEKDDLINRLFRDTVLLYIFLIFSIIIINNFVLRRVWNPFYDFLEQLKSYRLGSQATHPNVRTKTKEFLDLQKATNTLLLHNISSFEQQKQFIGNASHELQTPLAIALNKLELYIEKRDLKSEHINDIGETITIIERLIRLNKSLLLLTKIENKQFLRDEKISLNLVVEKGIQELEEIAAFKRIYISTKENHKIIVNMDPALSDILIFNLLRNVVFHTKREGTVLIEVTKNQIKFSNSGEITLHPDTIFNRFQKSGSQSGGSGLGLSIVKAICDFYDFKISYHFENHQHHFKIQFLQ